MQKHNHSLINRYTAGAVLLIVMTVAVAVAWHKRTDAVAAARPTVGAAVSSQFSFTGADDWWQGATSKTSMALFHDYDCFTSVQHLTGTVDAAAELQKLQASQAGDGGTSTPGAVLTTTLQTNTGARQYELHRYTLSNPNIKLMQGLELGYVTVPGGYLKVEGHCDTADKLPETIPALQAITFDQAK